MLTGDREAPHDDVTVQRRGHRTLDPQSTYPYRHIDDDLAAPIVPRLDHIDEYPPVQLPDDHMQEPAKFGFSTVQLICMILTVRNVSQSPTLSAPGVLLTALQLSIDPAYHTRECTHRRAHAKSPFHWTGIKLYQLLPCLYPGGDPDIHTVGCPNCDAYGILFTWWVQAREGMLGPLNSEGIKYCEITEKVVALANKRPTYAEFCLLVSSLPQHMVETAYTSAEYYQCDVWLAYRRKGLSFAPPEDTPAPCKWKDDLPAPTRPRRYTSPLPSGPFTPPPDSAPATPELMTMDIADIPTSLPRRRPSPEFDRETVLSYGHTESVSPSPSSVLSDAESSSQADSERRLRSCSSGSSVLSSAPPSPPSTHRSALHLDVCEVSSEDDAIFIEDIIEISSDSSADIETLGSPTILGKRKRTAQGVLSRRQAAA